MLQHLITTQLRKLFMAKVDPNDVEKIQNSIVFTYRGKYYIPDGTGNLVESSDIANREVYNIISRGNEPPFNFENKFTSAYSQYQSSKAIHYYNEICLELKLTASQAQELELLRTKYDEYTSKFKEAPYWKTIMHYTPRSLARRTVLNSSAKNWPSFIIRTIDNVSKVEDAYGYWLILRWLRIQITKREKVNVLSKSSSYLAPSGKSPDQLSTSFNFVNGLQGGFKESDLISLLNAINFIDTQGKTLKFIGGLIHDLIDILELEEVFYHSNREIAQKALQRYLGLEETRKSKGAKGGEFIRNKTIAYLTEWKDQRKINR